MTRRPASPTSARRLVSALLAVATLATAAVAAPPESDADAASSGTLRFHRVIVPRGRLDEVPLGDGRLVPLPVEEFDAAIRALADGGRPGPREAGFRAIDDARYRGWVAVDGRLEGFLEFEADAGAVPATVSLGTLAVDRARFESEGRSVDAPLFGIDATRLGTQLSRPGRMSLHWTLTRTGVGSRFCLPLAPALRSTIELGLPAGVVPLVEGNAWVRQARPATSDANSPQNESVAGGRPVGPVTQWRIEAGPLDEVAFTLVPERDAAPRVACWQHAAVAAGQIGLVAAIVPRSPWRRHALGLALDPRLVVESISAAPGGREDSPRRLAWSAVGPDGSTEVFLPEDCLGTLAPITITAAAPWRVGRTDAEALPLVRPAAAEWAGGGLVVEVDTGLSLVDIDLEHGVAVSAERSSGWPVGPRHRAGGAAVPPGGDQDAAAEAPASIAIEQQSPDLAVRIAVVPSDAEIDLARVTTVDVSATRITGRLVGDLRVSRGAAFGIEGRIGGDWFIDSVEIVDRRPGDPESSSTVVETVDWRVVRDRDGDLLRIALPTAATPSRPLIIRIAGHRSGVATEVPFPCADMDMVRLTGEAEDLAILALSSSTETTIELDRPAAVPAAIPERLAALAGETALRAWIPVDGPAASGIASLLERRPPVGADNRVRLTVRDDRMTESYTFSCRPEASALDAVVVRFSQPTDDLLDWTLLPPARSSLAVRRLGPGGAVPDPAEGGESWLVEFQPPLREEAVIRATRVVAFNGPTPVPLAWVEGSERQSGGVVIVNAGRRRPQIINRRLEELPHVSGFGNDELPKGTVAEFAYTPAIGSGPALIPAAELVPGGRDRDEDARAWVWNEETTCWCHPTGVTEYATRFEIENHGRPTVSLGPAGAVMPRGVSVDGVAVSASPDGLTGALIVDLPAERRFVTVVVRSEALQHTGRGAWPVELAGTGIDMPVLERTWRVLLAGGVEILAVPGGLEQIGGGAGGWVERLLPVTRRRPDLGPAGAEAARGRRGTIDAGFRERSFVMLAPRGRVANLLLVHSRWLWGAALLMFLLCGAVALGLRRRVTRLVAGAAFAVATLWVPLPLDGLARAALWGFATALVLRWMAGAWRTNRPSASGSPAAAPLALAVMVALAAPAMARQPDEVARAEDAESLPVFVVPELGGDDAASGESGGFGTALVPESLFRILSSVVGRRAEAGARILATRLVVRPAVDDRWTLLVDVDADAGAVLALRQEEHAAWDGERIRIDERSVAGAVSADGRQVRVGFAAGGRHRLELGMLVSPAESGSLRRVRLVIPVAPRSDVVVEGPLAATAGPADPVQLVASAPDGRDPRIVRGGRDGSDGAVRDVSRCGRVEVLWASDGRTPIADTLPTVDSRNDVAWVDGACRLVASFTVDPGEQIVRAVVVRASPRLGPIVLADPAATATALGGGRFLVERTAPRKGRVTIEASFAMPLEDAVGVFELPEAWLEGAVADSRTTQIQPAADLVVKPTLPEDAVPATPRVADGLAGLAWRVETGRAARGGEGDFGPGGGTGAVAWSPQAGTPARIAVERRHHAVRGSQRMDLEFAAADIRLRLQARLDAGPAPLVVVPIDVPRGGIVERVVLREQPAGGGGESVLDVRWRREAEDRINVVVQRPRTGTFGLEVVVRIPGLPAASGHLPVVRAALESGTPLTVTWKVGGGKWAIVGPPGSPDDDDGTISSDTPPAANGSEELAALDEPPSYRLVDVPRGDDLAGDGESGEGAGTPPGGSSMQAGTSAAGPWAGGTGPRVALAETRMAIDARGRAWGVSRFDLVATESLVRIQLPPGMRMFDVFVDGRVAADAAPARTTLADNAWELRLLDTGWPRSIVAVFAGEVADGLPRDGVIAIRPPAVVGLACERSTWVLELPHGVVGRPSPPAVAVDAESLGRERRAALESLVPGFERAIDAASDTDARRLGEYLRQRRREVLLSMPPEWTHVGTRDRVAAAAWAPPLHIIGGAGESALEVAIARRAESSTAGRSLATLLVLAAVVGLLEARRRTPLVARYASILAAARWLPATIALAAGVSWIAALDPVWPGWGIVLAGGGTLLAGAARDGWLQPKRGPVAASQAAAGGEAVTRLIQIPRQPSGRAGSTVRPRS